MSGDSDERAAFSVWPCPVTAPPSSFPSLLSPAVCALRGGAVVAVPTETVYGLAGVASNASAVQRIFRAKGRPSDNPLIVHVHSLDAVHRLCLPLSASERALADAFWPGPLTLLLTARVDAALSPLVTAGQPTVAVRIPAHPVALALLSLLDLPLAAPSANLSGRPSPTSAAHVARDLGRAERGVRGVVDGGESAVGLESSVVQVLEQTSQGPVRVRILRPGAVTRERLCALLPHALVEAAGEAPAGSSAAPLAPGMKYAHYQPSAPFVLLDGSAQWRTRAVRRALALRSPAGSARSVGVICCAEDAEQWSALQREAAGSLSLWVTGAGVEGLAHDLFRALRALDEEQRVDLLVAAVVPREGLGEALMNRMDKAAAGRRWTEGEGERTEAEAEADATSTAAAEAHTDIGR